MASFGVNVPPGVAVHSLDEVKGAAEKMKSPDGEVCGLPYHENADYASWTDQSRHDHLQQCITSID